MRAFAKIFHLRLLILLGVFLILNRLSVFGQEVSATKLQEVSESSDKPAKSPEELEEILLPADNIWEWKNSFIRLFVNIGEQEMGRFALDTTGGDPERREDDDQPLIYGRPIPWTSYTTIRIQGYNYAFGGSTERRAGKTALYGKLIQPPTFTPEGIHTSVYAYPLQPEQSEQILVTQSLIPVQGLTTKAVDTLLLQYEIENQAEEAVEVGVRILLDTMLGSNDGAPLRAGPFAIDSEKCFDKDAIPDFLQAFDSLAQPTVISQATLRGEGLTPPDLIYIANWGTLADQPWQPLCREGTSLIREGEDELDSAVALYWLPAILPAGSSRTIRVMYGLGGLTIAHEGLLLGLSTLYQVRYKPKAVTTFSVMGYVENVSPIPVVLKSATMQLPPGITFVEGKSQQTLEEILSPGATRQFFWKMMLDGSSFGEGIITWRLYSAEYGTSTLKRGIQILPPPILKARLEAPETLNVVDAELQENPFSIRLFITNPESTTISSLSFSVEMPEGMHLPPPEKNPKFLSFLDPQETYSVYWKVKTVDGLGYAQVQVLVDSPEISTIRLPFQIFVPALPPRLKIFPVSSRIYTAEYFFLDVKAEKMANITSARFTIAYDPFRLKLIRVEPGTISFRQGYRFGTFQQKPGKISFDFSLSPDAVWNPSETFLRLHFRALSPGVAKVNVENSELEQSGKKIDVPALHGTVEILEK